jgi:hypothetical protein
MIIYPEDMPPIKEELEAFMSHPSEMEDNKHVAYEHIATGIGESVVAPKFCRLDSDIVQRDPVFAAAAPEMLTLATQVSVGSSTLVLENGPNVMNSSDEDSSEGDHGEVLTGVYANGLKAPVVLSQSDVAFQKGRTHALKTSGFWVDSNAPDTTSTTSDWAQPAPCSPQETRSGSRFDHPDTISRNRLIPRAQTPTGDAPKKPTVSTVSSLSSPSKDQKRQTFLSDSSAVSEDEPPPAVLVSSRVVPDEEVTRSKRPSASVTAKSRKSASSSQSDAAAVEPTKEGACGNPVKGCSPDPQEPRPKASPRKNKKDVQGAGKKAAARPADSEATHPMDTRQRSRAGGFCPVGGSGSTDTCVASSHPSQPFLVEPCGALPSNANPKTVAGKQRDRRVVTRKLLPLAGCI